MCVSKTTTVAARMAENNSSTSFFVDKKTFLHLRNLAALHALTSPPLGVGLAHRRPPVTPHQQDLPPGPDQRTHHLQLPKPMHLLKGCDSTEV